MNDPALLQALAAKCDAVTKLQIARLNRDTQSCMFVHDDEVYDDHDHEHFSSAYVRFAKTFCTDYKIPDVTPCTVAFYKEVCDATLCREDSTFQR